MARSGTSRPGRRHAAVLAALVVAGTASVPTAAHARPDYPPDIAHHLSAAVDPACSVCHLDGKTGGITVITPFALALRAHGFTGSGGSLNAALDAMQADGADTDGDGVSDVAELRAGTDPNSPVPGATTADPQYGCSVASPRGQGGAAALAVAFAAALALRRRRRGPPSRARSRRGLAPPLSGAAARPSSACLRARP